MRVIKEINNNWEAFLKYQETVVNYWTNQLGWVQEELTPSILENYLTNSKLWLDKNGEVNCEVVYYSMKDGGGVTIYRWDYKTLEDFLLIFKYKINL